MWLHPMCAFLGTREASHSDSEHTETGHEKRVVLWFNRILQVIC